MYCPVKNSNMYLLCLDNVGWLIAKVRFKVRVEFKVWVFTEVILQMQRNCFPLIVKSIGLLTLCFNAIHMHLSYVCFFFVQICGFDSPSYGLHNVGVSIMGNCLEITADFMILGYIQLTFLTCRGARREGGERLSRCRRSGTEGITWTPWCVYVKQSAPLPYAWTWVVSHYKYIV